MKKIFIFSVFVLSMVLVGCAPSIVCEQPSRMIGDRCCLDEDGNGVCDSMDVREEAAVEAPVEEDITEPGPVVEAAPEPEPVKAVTKPAPVKEVKEPVTPAELKAGKFDIQFGEPKKYVEINKLEMHRYSNDKVMFDTMWYTVRNVGTKKLNPEVRIRAEGVRTGDSEYSSSSVERTYILEPLLPGEKEVIELSMGLRYGGMNLTKTLTIDVFERYTAPKESIGKTVKEFKPINELESMDIWWTDSEE